MTSIHNYRRLIIACCICGIYGSHAANAADAHDAPGEDSARLSNKGGELIQEGFPDRPAMLLELGDKFLSPGNLRKGFTLPTGANWTPNLWVFGQYRTALQTFEPSTRNSADGRITEWANRLDITANLQLAATERVVLGLRPLEKLPSSFVGYQFHPSNANTPGSPTKESRGVLHGASLAPRTLFFEGEIGEIFPTLDQHDKLNFDYGISVGRQALTVQDGLLLNDDSIDALTITRNHLTIPGGSKVKLSAYYAWNQIERGDNVRDKKARLYGVNAVADFPGSTVDLDLIYVQSEQQGVPGALSGGNGVYGGIGFNQRINTVNTVFRVNASVAPSQATSSVKTGTLLFTELSYTPLHTPNLIYLNGFWAIDSFTSAARAPDAGGALGRIGILTAAIGIGRYGSPISNATTNAAGAALGYQIFFGETKSSQLILEVAGRTPTRNATTLGEERAAGVAARYQRSVSQRTILQLDAFGVTRRTASNSYGARAELLVKF